jgi:hypothetical protein
MARRRTMERTPSTGDRPSEAPSARAATSPAPALLDVFSVCFQFGAGALMGLLTG